MIIKAYKSFKRNLEIKSICRKYQIENYSINKDGSIDVKESVFLSRKGLTKLPLKFRNVEGNFNCNENELTSLEGAPQMVEGHFKCDDNDLTSLFGAPKIVHGPFYCGLNKLTSLEHSPELVNGFFQCQENSLTDFEGISERIGRYIDVSRNQISSFRGFPENFNGRVLCLGNPIQDLFSLYSKIDFINLINEYGVISRDGKRISEVRLRQALEESGSRSFGEFEIKMFFNLRKSSYKLVS